MVVLCLLKWAFLQATARQKQVGERQAVKTENFFLHQHWLLSPITIVVIVPLFSRLRVLLINRYNLIGVGNLKCAISCLAKNAHIYIYIHIYWRHTYTHSCTLTYTEVTWINIAYPEGDDVKIVKSIHHPIKSRPKQTNRLCKKQWCQDERATKDPAPSFGDTVQNKNSIWLNYN